MAHQGMEGGNEDAAVKHAESLRDAGLLRGYGKARQVRNALLDPFSMTAVNFWVVSCEGEQALCRQHG